MQSEYLPNSSLHNRTCIALSAGVFLVASLVFFYLFSLFPLIHDGDSYYHLAVARAYSQQGFFDRLEWARYSVMGRSFGDKEFLFHVLLIPFVNWMPSTWGPQLALALLNGLTAAMLAYLGLSSIGNWGLFVPVWVFGTSAAFTLRMTRLRPEILSLLILLGATWAASRRRYWWLFVLSGLYALSYTAFQALLGLCLVWFVLDGWVNRSWDWRLLVHPVLGVAGGLLLHPHFPSNLQIWALQNIDFFHLKKFLDVGNEIQSSSTSTILTLNLGWLLGLAIFWRSIEKKWTQSTEVGVEVFYLANAVAFSYLYLLMQRFSTYCIPFVTLSLLFYIKHKDYYIGRWTYLPGRGKIPFVAAFGLCLCTSMLSMWYVYVNLSSHSVFDARHLNDWRAFNRILPKDARVAAPWNAAELYVWAAPQARYLNVLDPLFMAIPYPDLYSVQQDIWQGEEQDVPLAIQKDLQSEYIAFPLGQNRQLFARLAADPRVRLLYQGDDVLFQIKHQPSKDFILDWKLMPEGTKWPPDEKTVQDKGVDYPRLSDPDAYDTEGYVDGLRFNSNANCLNFVHIEDVDTPALVEYELSPYGPASFRHNGKLIATTLSAAQAVLGRGIRFSLNLDQGRHLFSVTTCRRQERVGFYLLERSRSGKQPRTADP